jgi:uncharacterized membrane protein YfcA
LILALGVTLAAVVSAIFGLAGGTLVFALLSWSLDAKQAIPLHSAIQLVGNLARFTAFWKFIQWRVVGLFALLLLPGAWLGGLLFNYFDPLLLEFLVGTFIFFSIFIPEGKMHNTRAWMFVLLGFLSSFLGMIVAVTGPFIASFFVLNNLSKEELIATKSVCQALTQVVKTAIFVAAVGFDFGAYRGLLLLLCAATIIGTYLGRWLMNKISQGHFDQINRILLALIALGMWGNVLRQLMVN